MGASYTDSGSIEPPFSQEHVGIQGPVFFWVMFVAAEKSVILFAAGRLPQVCSPFDTRLAHRA